MINTEKNYIDILNWCKSKYKRCGASATSARRAHNIFVMIYGVNINRVIIQILSPLGDTDFFPYVALFPKFGLLLSL